MVEHVLLFRWNEQTSEEAINRALMGVCGLKEKIAGIVAVSCGLNFSERAKGYTHGLVMRFTDRAALNAYYPHPDHQHVVKTLLNPILVDVLALDYEF